MQIRKQHLQFCVVASSTQDTAPKGFPAVGPPGTLVLPLKPHKSITVVMPGVQDYKNKFHCLCTVWILCHDAFSGKNNKDSLCLEYAVRTPPAVSAIIS